MRQGVPALAQTEELARELRRLMAVGLALEHPSPELAEVVATLRGVTDRLEDLAPVAAPPRLAASGADGDRRVYLDHAFHIGAYNAAFPEYEIAVDGARATGTVRFPIVYEGPPGFVHGGFLAVLFDSVIQHHNCALGESGKTARLEVDYRRPVPLLTTLTFAIDRHEEGRRIHSSAELAHDGQTLAEARMVAVRGTARPPATAPRKEPR